MMLISPRIDNVRETFKALAPRGDELAELFFERLFEREPFLRAVLPRDHWMRARDLMTGLGQVVKNLHRLEAIEHILLDLGAKAQRAGVSPQHYGIARQALLAAMREIAGDDWNPDADTDWTDTLNAVSSVVLLGAGRARAKAA